MMIKSKVPKVRLSWRPGSSASANACATLLVRNHCMPNLCVAAALHSTCLALAAISFQKHDPRDYPNSLHQACAYTLLHACFVRALLHIGAKPGSTAFPAKIMHAQSH